MFKYKKSISYWFTFPTVTSKNQVIFGECYVLTGISKTSFFSFTHSLQLTFYNVVFNVTLQTTYRNVWILIHLCSSRLDEMMYLKSVWRGECVVLVLWQILSAYRSICSIINFFTDFEIFYVNFFKVYIQIKKIWVL